MKNLHLIPTDKPSRLVKLKIFGKDKYNLSKEILPIQDEEQYQNIYITSDEEIKEGDYCISHLNIIDEGKIHNSQTIFNPKTKEHLILLQSCKKIILTDNEDLINDGVQAIEDEFLEWFVKNPSCEEVKVVIMNEGYDKSEDVPYQECYKIIIPKEEPTEEAKQRAENYMSLKGALEPKQESLEEAAERMSKEHYVDQSDYWAVGVDSFKRGAKWQQERMYSKEEVIAFAQWMYDYKGDINKVEELLKQFKKK